MDISYNIWLVFLSLALSVVASYAALSIASRIPYVDRRSLWLWLGGGAISMGLAIWSMHFVGMLAFHIDIPLAYDIPLTELSILFAIIASGAALIVVRTGYRNLTSLIIATFFMGSGIAAMHYTGMEALQMLPGIIYDRFLFILSLMIAYVASFIALVMFFSESGDSEPAHRIYNNKRLISSVLMGVAIAGMHYTAMEAAIFSPGAVCGALGKGIASGVMSVLIIIGVTLIIIITLLLLMLDIKLRDNILLQKSEQRVRQMIANAPQGMLVTDEAGTIQQLNNIIESMFGYRSQELIGNTVEMLMPIHMREIHSHLRESFIKKPKSRDMGGNNKLHAKRKDGSEFLVEIGLAPMKTEEQTLVIATITDVTERDLLEQELDKKRKALESANQRILLAADAAEIGIFDYNLLDQSLIFDDWMYRIYGISPEQFDGTYNSWEKLLHPDDLSFAKTIMQEAIRYKKPIDFSFRIITPENNVRWIKANAAVTFDKEDAPLRIIGINQDITEKIEKEELIWKQANYDTLTQLPNRKLFHDLLGQEIKEAHRNKKQLWILFLDLDGFKEVNDTLGHDIGDSLLLLVSKRIQSVLREADIIARFGGDEFVIVLPEESKVDTVATKIVDVISENFELDNHEVHITASIGIANYPNDADNITDLLKFSDQSMYEAKKEGKNRFSYFTPELQKASRKRAEVSTDLRQALQRNDFQLHYQPIVSLDTYEIDKAEVLIRWKHPEKGFISPAEFIPIAEETGVIAEIGIWVFDNAFKQLQSWQSNVRDGLQLSINMSPFQLKINDKKYDNWLKRLDSYSLSGESIVIEITEGLLLKSTELVMDRILQYRDAGVQVAIDDFGTGYSSLAYLNQFDIDYLKIDKSFIRHLTPGSSAHSLSEAIVVMAHKLGLKVIAEGIESELQRDLLVKMGCDYGQGYLFSKPLPANEFEKIMLN